MKVHSLVRIRFDLPLLTRVDALATEIRALIKKRIPRAALVRALCKLALEHALAPELATVIKLDSVRRGRAKDPQPRKVAA